MEIYNIYQSIISFFCTMKGSVSVLRSNPQPFIVAIAVSVGIIGVLFFLQAIGLFVMAKKRNMDKKWLCFIPFAATYQIGRLSGPCEIFGRKMKNAGLWAMLSQIVSFIFCASFVFAEYYLFVKCGATLTVDQNNVVTWESLATTGVYMYNYYRVANYLVSIFGIIESVLVFILVMGLFKKYSVKNYMLLSWLSLFIPMARFVIVFVLRKNEPVDFEAYMRAKREAYARRMASYGNPYGNPYGNNSYGNNPYGNNPYGQPSAPRQPEELFEEFNRKADEPFSEFSKGNGEDTPYKGTYSERGEEKSEKGEENKEQKKPSSDEDDLFD